MPSVKPLCQQIKAMPTDVSRSETKDLKSAVYVKKGMYGRKKMKLGIMAVNMRV
jgi:hypothetical protein